MNNKKIALIFSLIPIVSAVVSFCLIMLNFNSLVIKVITSITIICAFSGFIFFFIARTFDKKSKVVKVLGIFDWLTSFCVIAFYTVAIFVFGL